MTLNTYNQGCEANWEIVIALHNLIETQVEFNNHNLAQLSSFFHCVSYFGKLLRLQGNVSRYTIQKV